MRIHMNRHESNMAKTETDKPFTSGFEILIRYVKRVSRNRYGTLAL